MKRYEGCSGVSGWLISHLGWFVILGIIALFLFLLQGCREGGSGSENTGPKPNESGASTPHDWTMVTPEGITVYSQQSTIDQYELKWGKGSWARIDWVTLDQLFDFYKDFYCNQQGWSCSGVSASQLSIYIKPWSEKCPFTLSDGTGAYKIYDTPPGHETMCVNGWYDGRTLFFHLNVDPGIDRTVFVDNPPNPPSDNGTDFYAFEESCFPHELMHFFQEVSGRASNENDPQGAVDTVLLQPEEKATDPN